MEKPLQTLHKALLANKYDVPESYDDFEYTLSLPGDEGYQNRHQLWKSLKENNFDVPDNYEDFSGTLFVPKQPQRKKGMIANTVNTEDGMTFTEAGFDSLQNGAKPVYTGSSSEAEAEPQPTEPIDLSRPEEYQIPKPFVQGAAEARQMADSPELNKQWAQRQAMAAVRSTKPDVYNFGDRMYSLEMAQQADAARQMKRAEFDNANKARLNELYDKLVSPVFTEERAAGEERAKKAVQEHADEELAGRLFGAPQTVAGASSNYGRAFQAAVDVERETDPAKIAAATIKRVQNDDAFGDYVLSRMGISGQTDSTGAGKSEPLSDREKKYMQLLFATETNEVADQMIQRIYDQYKAEGAPKSALDYIAGKAFHENFVTSLFDAMVRRVANSSGMREQLRAMASEEYGQDASWLTRAAGAAAPFAVDMLTGGFAAPTAVGNALVKGGMRMAAKEVTREMGKRAAARGLKDAALEEAIAGGTGVAERYLATQAPILNFALRSAGSAANFATYDVQSEAVRQLSEGEFNAGNLIKQAVHGATLGGVLGATGGVIANATRNSGLAKKVLADIAGVGAETGIFAAANGIEKAHQLGIDIADVDWADTTGEALGMVLGMKTVGAVTHPKEFLKRYQQSKDLGMQLNQRDIDELKQAGYDMSTIFKGLGEFGKIAPEAATIRRGAAEYTEDATGKRGQRNTETTEAYVDADAFDAVMRNPEISSSLKRKVAFIATGKVLSLEPVFGASIDVDDNGKVTITTKNVYGNPIETKEYDSVEQAQQEFQLMQEMARTNTIGGLERIADKVGYEDVKDTAKGRTKEETGIDVDNVDELSDLTTEEANSVMDAYIKNLQDAYMERFNENLKRIGDVSTGDVAGTPQRTERRQAAYERGASVAEDESQLPVMNYDGKLAGARMMALMPDGDQAGYARQQVQQALEQGDVEAAERILQQQSPYLTPEQREAVDAFIDTFEMRLGIDDAVEQSINNYEQNHRQYISSYLADPQGNVTALRLKDNSIVYYQSGDMNGYHSSVFVTDGEGNTKQIDSNEIAQVEYTRPAEEMIAEDVASYSDMIAKRYNYLADGSMLLDGQEYDMVMGNQLFHVKAIGQEMGNNIVQMEDGSRMAMSPEQTAEAIDAADMLKIQELLAQEKNAAAEQQRTQRFSKGIVGYDKGTPALTNKDTNPEVAAEYLLSQTDANGQPVDRKVVLDGIQKEVDRINGAKEKTLQALQNIRNSMAMADENEPTYHNYESIIKDFEEDLDYLQQDRRKWGEIRLAMMTVEERQAFEKDRIKEIGKAKSQSKIAPSEGTPEWMVNMPTKEQVVEKYPERSDGEAFVEEQRKQLSQMYRQDVYPKYDDIQKQLDDYQHGLTDLTPDEVKALTDQQANLSMRMTEMVNEMNAWKKLGTELARAYTVNERQNMTPHEQAMAKLAGETDKMKKLKLAQEAFKDDPDAAAILDNVEPQDVYEHIAENLGAHSINWEGLKRGEHEVRGLIADMGKDKKRGVGAGYDTNGYNYFLAPTGEGKGIDEIIHDLYEGSPYRDDEVRNALLTMLKEAEKPTDISHYVINNRIAQAEQIYEQNRERERDLEEEAKRQAEDEAIMQMTGMTPEEYDAYISDLEQRLTEQEGYQNSEEYFNQLANEYDRTNERRAGGSQEESTLVVQGQEGKQAAAETEGETGTGEADGKLAAMQADFDAFSKKYHSLAPIDVVSLDSDDTLKQIYQTVVGEKLQPEEVEAFRQGLKDSKLQAVYDPISKKIYIFAENVEDGKAEEWFFHENLHRGLEQYYGDGLREVAEAFWNTVSPTNPEGTERRKASVLKQYADKDEATQHEEYLVHALGYQMTTGTVTRLLDRMSPEHREIIENILKNIGYDTAKEAKARNAEEKSAGEIPSEGTRLQGGGSAGGVKKSSIQGLENYSEDEIKDIILNFVQQQLENADADVKLMDIAIIGSRTNGTAKPDSDLDVLVEYKGKEREDDLFNLLNDADEPLFIEGIKVDINPITEGKSGTIAQFLERNADYKKEKETVAPQQVADDILKEVTQIDGNPNYSKEEQKSLKYIPGESFEEYAKRNNSNVYQEDMSRLYLQQKYAERLDEIAGVIGNITEDNAKEAGKQIGMMVDSRAEGYAMQYLLKRINPGAVLPFNDGVSEAFTSFPLRLAKAKAETNVNPTEEQKKAGNYKMGHISFGGYQMSIENPKGSIRSGVDANGKPWSIDMQDTYGYIREKYGTDKDHLDFFINDDADLDNWNGRVYVVDQKNEDGTFDEHKVMYGYPSYAAAKKAYLRNYEDGWWDKHVMQMTGVRKSVFDKWLEDSDYKTKPFANYSRTRQAETVSNNMEQLMADVEERKNAKPVGEVEAGYKVGELEAMNIDELKQARKKRKADLSTARLMLGTIDKLKDTEKGRKLQNTVAQATADIAAIEKEIEKKSDLFRQQVEQQEIGGAMVDQLENMGFDVSTDPAEMRKVRKQAEKDNSEEGKLRHFETPDGKIYGFVYRGKMYLDPRKIDAELPIHEYAHPWCEAFRRLNPEGWKNIVGLMKADKDTWEFIKAVNPDLKSEDDIAEEMITKCSGQRGAEWAEKEYARMNQRDPNYKSKWGNIWKNISKAIQDFWKAVGDFLHIKYESAEQVYDQVVRDFANKMNPRKRVEEWLKERDDAYMEAVNKGDTEQAKELFDAALRENIGNGIVPYIAAENYRKMRPLAHAIKERDPKVIAEVADMMAPLIPKDAVLVPAPSHSGKATDMLDLAKAISERTGAPVADVLTSGKRGSQYEAKYAGKPIASSEMGIVAATDQLPADKLPVVIDNVVDTGNTAEACVQALGKGIVASLADSADRYKHVAALKSAEPVVTDRNGNVVPLSKRFEIGGKYLEKPAAINDGENAAEVHENPAGIVAEPEGAVETVLKEVERRKEVAADKKEAEDIIKQYLKRKPKAEEERVKQLATKAVLKAMDNAGVPYKAVSKEEEKQMLQIFSMMNQEPIKEFARSPRMRATSAHGRRGRYIIYDMSNPYGVPMYFEKLSTAKFALKGMKQLVPGGSWEIMDIGYPEDTAMSSQPMKKAAEYYELMQMMGDNKKASEPAVPRDESPFKATAISNADAKVINNLEELVKKSENFNPSQKKDFLKSLSEALGAERQGSGSRYVTIEAKNGTVVTLRLADHNVTVSRFDYSGEPNGVSIVVSRKPNEGITNDGNAHIVEYFYPDKELRKADGNPYAEIVKSVEQMLYSGEYKDNTGIAQPEEVNNPMDLQADIETWHGSGYTFTKFDHSNMGKGAGSQVFGWGTYLTNGEKIAEDYANSVAKRKYNDETPGYNGKEVLYKGEKIDLDQSKLDPLRLAYDTLNSEGTIRKAVTFVERLMDYAEEQDMKDTWQEVLNILKNSKKSDFKVRDADLTDKRLLYKVEIPEDTGDNYLDWMVTIKKPLRKKIADAVRQLDGEPKQSFIYTNYKNGWESLADMIEREQFAYKEIHDRLLMAFGGRVKDAERVSKLMNSLGFVGVKYPAGTIWGGGNGATNYVIFNEDDAKIVQTISFMWGDEPAAPIFISNALKAAEDIKQEKATPEQWLAMLQKNGGLKAGEDKWLGLSDWLKEQKGSVTKQDVLDYIRKNQIQVEDVNYSNIKRDWKDEDYDSLSVDSLPEVMKEPMEALNKHWSELYHEARKEADSPSQAMNAAIIKLREEYGKDFNTYFATRDTENLVVRNPRYLQDAAKMLGVEVDIDNPINGTRMAYTTNGLDNKREIALTVPTIEPWNESDEIHFGDAGGGRAVAWVRFGDTVIEQGNSVGHQAAKRRMDAYYDYLVDKYGNDDDPLAFAEKLTPEESTEMSRLEAEYDKTFGDESKKVLVIDEIQSKRHQEGREKGYDIPVTQLKKNGWRFIKAGNSWTLYDPDKKSRMQNIYAETEQEAWRQLESLTRSMGLHHGGIVPSAPFEKNWHELAMKRMLRYAAENGYDKIAWTTGEQQADRYDIGDKIKDISVSVATDPMTGKPLEGKYEIFPHNHNNSTIMVDGASGVMDKDQVLRVYGKDLGQKMIDAADKAGVDGDVLSGDDLRIGAEGMKGFYDDILPRFMNKYGKKWGVKVEKIDLPGIGENANGMDGGLTMWSIDVTPEMKESVMQGQPMFQKEGKKLLGWSDGKQVYLTKDGLNPNTPLHETTHLWDNWCMKEHPDLWQKLVAAMKKTAMWEEVASNPNYRNIWNDENRMASEVHARLSGAAGEDEFMKAAFKKNTPQSIINEVKNALRKFWEAVLRLFGKHTKTIGDDWTSLDAIIRMPIRDLVNQDFEKVMRVAEPYADAEGAVAQAMKGEIIERTLMGVHNLSEDKLRKVIKAGGLANPSLAVVDTNQGIHTSYGDISLIPKASLIDKRTGRNAGTFAGDAWTPTYPHVERMLTKQGEKRAAEIAKEVAGDDEEMARHIRSRINDYYEGAGDRMHFLFLKQKGLNPQIRPERIAHSQDEYDAITKIFGEPTSNMPNRESITKEQNDALVDLMVSVYEKKLRAGMKDPDKPLDEKTQQLFDASVEEYRKNLLDDAGYIWFAKGDNFIYDNWRDEKRRQNPQPDWYGTDNDASYQVAKEGLAEEYEKWKESLLTDNEVEEKLFAGYTPGGNRRYLPNTVENASRLMNKNAEQNAYDDHGFGPTRAMLLQNFASLADIRRHKDLIQKDETVEERTKELSDELFDIINQISDMQKISDNHFSNIDYAEARLQEAMGKKNPIRHLNKEYGYNIPEDGELASQLMNFMEDVKNLPAKYFETKFKRPVTLDEFEIAVVPEGTSEDVVKALKDAGLDVRTFDNTGGEEVKKENRRKAVMDAVTGRNDILFHIEDDPQTVARLESEPTEKGYRNVVANEDGTLGSPMANRLGKKGEGKKATTPFEYGKWERSDEHPELANEQGKIDLIKPDGKPVGGVDYNPYIHIRPNKVNKQFKQAWERPNLIYVETEYPKSELNGDYRAVKAAKTVGKHKWGTQGEYLILSRWDKPVRMVPWEEVADDWVKEFEGTDGIHFDIIPPKLLPILAERGMKILPPHKGMGKDCQEAYKEWKDEHDIMRSKGKKLAAHDTTGFADVAEAAGEAVGGVKVNAVTSADADAKLKAEIENGTKGIYDPNTHTVTLLLDNIEDAADAVRTVFHEKLGHEGLVDLLGSQEAVDKFGTFVYRSAKNDVRNRILAKADEIDPEWKDGARYSKAAQEVLADIAEEGPKTADEFDLWTKVKHYLIALLNMLGLKIRGLLNDKDLAYYIVKTGAALKKWNAMSEEARQNLAQQASNHDIMRSMKGKPRQKKGESMAEYFQRLKEWEKWREARRMAKENGDPEPKEEDFHERAEADYKQALQEWKDDNGITVAASAGTFPKRQEGETPQEYAVRVAQYESDKDMWATAPQLMDYLRRANDEYRAAYTAWRERYDLQEELTVDQRIYEGAVDPQPTFTDAEQEAQYLAEKELADAEGFEIDEEGAKRMAKLAVIERRKDFESANAEDAIWVYDFMKKSDAVAKELSKRIPDATGKELRAALPFLIEADRRRENLEAERENAVMEVNKSKAVQDAHSFIDYYNMDAIEDELRALNEAWDYKEKHPTGDAQQAYREAAARLAEKLNELNKDKGGYNKLYADDIMQIRSLLNNASVTGRGKVMPTWAEKYQGLPEVQQLMEHIKAWYDEFYQVLEDAGLRGDAGFIDDGYVNHVWDKEKSDPKAWEQYIENRQRTKSPNMRHREIDTYMDGMSIGLVPKYTDIADMIAHYSRQNNEAVANSHFLDDLKFVVVQEMNDEGEVKAILPLLMTDKPDGLLRDKYAQYYVPGVGDVYVLKHIQKRFANIFGTMRTPDAAQWLSNFGKGYDIISSTAKKIQLALSGFHALALFEVDIAQNGPVDALKHLVKYIITDSYKGGALPAYTHPEDFQLAAKHLVQLGATEDYAAADVNAITKKMREYFKGLQMDDAAWKKAAGTVGSPAAIFMDWINQGFDTVLWNYLHDGLKLCAFKELAKQVDRRVADKGLDDDTRERLLDEAGQYVNDMFGGQYWELLNVSPATLKWMRRFFLSPDWLVSTQRHFFANFGFGSIYSDGGFREYVKYNWDNIQRMFGKDVASNELRRLRSKNAKICYLIGAIVWFGMFYNAINALMRWMDEKDEKAKADEERKTNPNYKSPYELAYPDGMKWYDYTMYGNAVGQQTHLFTGRYSDGTETYVRWGKQFREFPELFIGRHGVEFPSPLIQRMMSKANPNIGTVIDFLGAQNIGGFNGSYENKELREKYGKTVATLSAMARHFIPFGMPTQTDKEYKWLDFFMPSSKGFSRYKAKDYFETFIMDGDWNGIEATYNACVMNGIDAEKALDAAISSIKATQRRELTDDVSDLSSAALKFDAATKPEERKTLLNKLKKHLKDSEYKVMTREEAIEKVHNFIDGEGVDEKENTRYIMLATSEDIIAEEKLKDLGRTAKKFKQELDAAKGSDKYAEMRERYGSWLKIGKKINKATRAINKEKKRLGSGMNEDEVMEKIREAIRKTQAEIDEMQAVE